MPNSNNQDSNVDSKSTVLAENEKTVSATSESPAVHDTESAVEDHEVKVETGNVDTDVDTETKSSVFSAGTISTLSIILLSLIAIFQMRQIDNLQEDNQWLLGQIDKLETKVDSLPKLAIMSFEDTVQAWRNVGSTGEHITKVMDSTIKSYNSNGYTILDSTAIIGGKADIEFINVTPDRYKEEADSEE